MLGRNKINKPEEQEQVEDFNQLVVTMVLDSISNRVFWR